MESSRLIIVPKNKAGIEKYNRGENGGTDSELFHLDEGEFVSLQRNRVFDILNDRFDLWIDDGESEKVTADQLKKVNREICPINGTWTEAVDRAIKYNTCIFLVF